MSAFQKTPPSNSEKTEGRLETQAHGWSEVTALFENVFPTHSSIQKSETAHRQPGLEAAHPLSNVARCSPQSQKWNQTHWAHTQQKLLLGEAGDGIQDPIPACMCTNSKLHLQNWEAPLKFSFQPFCYSTHLWRSEVYAVRFLLPPLYGSPRIPLWWPGLHSHDPSMLRHLTSRG